MATKYDFERNLYLYGGPRADDDDELLEFEKGLERYRQPSKQQEAAGQFNALFKPVEKAPEPEKKNYNAWGAETAYGFATPEPSSDTPGLSIDDLARMHGEKVAEAEPNDWDPKAAGEFIKYTGAKIKQSAKDTVAGAAHALEQYPRRGVSPEHVYDMAMEQQEGVWFDPNSEYFLPDYLRENEGYMRGLVDTSMPAYEQHIENLTEKSREYAEKQQAEHLAIEEKYGEGLSDAARFMGRAIGGTGQLAVQTGIGLVAPWAVLPTLGISAAGNTMAGAVLDGYDLDKAMAYGALSGLSEMGLESLSSVPVPGLKKIPGLTSGLLDEAIEAGVKKLPTWAHGAARILAGSIGEGFEELAGELIDPFLKVYTGMEDELKWGTKEEMFEAFVGGVVPSLIMGGAGAAGNRIYNNIAGRSQTAANAPKTDLGADGVATPATAAEGLTAPAVAERSPLSEASMRQVEQMGTDDGEAGVKALNENLPAIGEEGFSDFKQYYDLGKAGVPLEAAKDNLTTATDPAVLERAHAAGVADAKEAAKNIVFYGKDSGLVKDRYSNRLDSKSRLFLNVLGQTTGAKVRVVKSLEGDIGVAANAMYKDGVITISLDADNPIKQVMSHEVTHRLRETAPEAYTALSDNILGILRDGEKTGSRSFDALVERYKQMYESGDTDYVSEEIVADFVGEMLSDSKALESFVKDNRSAGEKLLDLIRDLVNKLRGHKLPAEYRSEFEASVKQLEKAEGLLIKALEQAREAAESETAAEGQGEARYSIVTVPGYGDVAVVDQMVAPMKGESKNAAIKRFFRENLRGKEVTVVESSGDVAFDQIGKYLYPGQKVVNFGVKQDAVSALADMVRVGTNRQHSNDYAENGKKKSHGGLDASRGWDYYDTQFIVDKSGAVWSGRVVVRNAANGKSYFYDLDKIKEAGRQGVSELNPVTDSTASDTNIADKKSGVNTILSEGGKDDARYSLKITGDRAAWTKERIDGLYDKYASRSQDYSKAYAAFISPGEFLSLTTTNQQQIEAESTKLDIAKLQDETQEIFLIYDPSEPGEVWGHEGRHRMAALQEAGIEQVPIVVQFRGEQNKSSRQPIASLNLIGEEFARGRAPGQVELTDLVPISQRYRAEVEAKFGEQADTAVRFSLKKPVEETKNLIALHNLTEQKLLGALGLGGFPVPSIAVTKIDIPHTNFGNITLVMNKSVIDPKANKRNTVYSADAWTPTFPRIEYEADPKAEKRLRDKYYDLARRIGYDNARPLYDYVTNTEDALNRRGGEQGIIDDLLDDTSMKNLYLQDIGRARIEDVQRETTTRLPDYTIEFYDHLIEALGKDAFGGLYPQGEESPVAARRRWLAANKTAIEDAYREYYRADGIPEADIDRVMEHEDKDFIKTAIGVRNYLRDGAATTRTEYDAEGTRKAIEAAVDPAAYKQWLHETFGGLVRNTGVYNEKDIFTPSGNRRSFKQTHYPVTLDNITKAMAARNDGNSRNVSGFYGIKSLRAGTAERFKSIADMHAREGRLQKLTQEQADAVTDTLNSRLLEIMGRVLEASPSNHRNSLIAMDSIGEIMIEAAEKGDYSVGNIGKVFAQYKYDIGPTLAAEIRDLLFDTSQMPVTIFEGKPERSVRFDEVLAAVLPDDASESLRGQLERQGVPVVEYKAGDEGARLEAVNSVEDARFSLKRTAEGDESAQLTELNALLREQYNEAQRSLEAVRAEFKLTESPTVDEKKADAAIKKLLKENFAADASGDYDPATVTAEIKALWNGMMAEGSYGEAREEAMQIARKIVENAEVLNDGQHKSYAELRSMVRGTPVYVADQIKADLPGGYAAFRKKNFGRMNLISEMWKGPSVTNATPDTLYMELAERWPGMFPEDIYNPADQLSHIAEVLDGLKPVYENPFAADMDYAVESMGYDLIEMAYDIPQKRTFADEARQVQLMERLKGQNRLDALREQKNERIKDIIARGREQRETAVRREKARREAAVEKLETKYRAKEQGAREKQKSRVLREKIKKHTEHLSKLLLKPTDKQHIPMELQQAVAGFLSEVDFNTDRIQEKRIEHLADLKTAYEHIANGQSEAGLDFDPDLIDNINAISKARLVDMTSEELETLYRVVLAVRKSVEMANKTFAIGKAREISKIAYKADAEMGKIKEHNQKRGVARLGDDLFNLHVLAPADYFEQLGGTMKGLYDEIRGGFDKKVSHIREATEFIRPFIGNENIREWTGADAKTVTVKLTTGTMELTPAQIMSFYRLSLQPDAVRHMEVGGAKPNDMVQLKKDGKAEVKKSTAPLVLTDADIRKIVDLMTPEQKKVADAIGAYFADDIAEWGNEVSLKMYGYKKFTVKNYFPIVSDRNYVPTSFAAELNASLKEMGITKARNQAAVNPIIIEDIFDVFTRQVDRMSSYNAFVMPLSDMERVYNYRRAVDDGEGGRHVVNTRQSIERAFGTGAKTYLENLMRDINGKVNTEAEAALMRTLTRNFKAAAVGGNLRVVIQQPTSYARAGSMIDAKYLVRGLEGLAKTDWETVKQYSAIAQWKDWGYFSLDTGRQIKDILVGDTGNLAQRVIEKGMDYAGKADEVTWKALWRAVELETLDRQPGLKEGTDAFNKAVGKRFSDIIDRTQVVDSVFHRTAMMRSDNDALKMATSFMSEPMKSYNGLRTSFENARRNPTTENKKQFVRTVAATYGSMITNAMVLAMFDSYWRRPDEDEDKRYWETVFWNVFEDTFGMAPFVRDLLSLWQGYSVERMDMEAASAVVRSLLKIGKWFEEKGYKKESKHRIPYLIQDSIKSVSTMLGLPTKNISRELESAFKVYVKQTGSNWVEYEAAKVFYHISHESNRSRFIDILYKAFKEGDDVEFRRIQADMIDSGVPPSKIRSGLRSRYDKDEDTEKGVKALEKMKGDPELYSFTTLLGVELKTAPKEETEEKYTIDNLDGEGFQLYQDTQLSLLLPVVDKISSDPLYIMMKEQDRADAISAAYAYADQTALAAASGGEYEPEHEWIRLAATAPEDLGLSTADYILYKSIYGAAALKTNAFAAAMEADVDPLMYLGYAEGVKDFTADYKDGKAVRGSEKAKILAEIDKLPIARWQKDEMYLSEGYAVSKIEEAPWNRFRW